MFSTNESMGYYEMHCKDLDETSTKNVSKRIGSLNLLLWFVYLIFCVRAKAFDCAQQRNESYWISLWASMKWIYFHISNWYSNDKKIFTEIKI